MVYAPEYFLCHFLYQNPIPFCVYPWLTFLTPGRVLKQMHVQ